MRILRVGHSRNDKILGISSTLTQMGHKVETAYTDPYSGKCSYWNKKIYEWGGRYKYNQYMSEWKTDFEAKVNALSPNFILFVDFWDEFFPCEEIYQLKQKYPLVLWLVDSIRRFEHHLDPYYKFFSKIWCFEEQDVRELQKQYHVNAEYLFVGYNNAYQNIANKYKSRKYDVCFVGAPYKNRLNLLEYILQETAVIAKICGPFYSMRYFWKKWTFKRKYPHIFKCLDNRFYSPDRVADMYAQSKICLNINLKKHKGISPRTYEIMEAGSLELLEEREEYGPILKPGENIITFSDKNDLLVKINYYLTHDKEREKMAKIGYEVVHDKASMINSLKRILDDMGTYCRGKNGTINTIE